MQVKSVGEIDPNTISPNLPRRGNWLTRKLARWTMRLFGWRVTGELPDRGKFIIVGAPHTSNWDFVLTIATGATLGISLHWMMKHTFFRGPINPLFRWMGGIPINRRAAHGVVGENVKAFARHDKFILCITPEGTRSKVRQWKSGFYHIATKANVPILLAAFDFGNREVRLGPLVQPSGNYEVDLAQIQAYYATVTPRHVHNQ